MLPSARALCCSVMGLGALGCSDYNFSPDKTFNEGLEETGTPVEVPPDSTPPAPVETGDTAPPAYETCEDAAPGSLPSPIVDPTCLIQSGWGLFEPTVEWQWNSNPDHPGFHQIMSTAMVANLTDDNGDGAIDTDDIPDIVFTSFAGGAYTSPGTITAISGDGSGQHWSIASSNGYRPYSSSAPAIADIDADGSPDICVASADATVLCLEADGSFKWAAGATPFTYGTPTIADLDADGLAEVVVGSGIFESDGTERVPVTSGCNGRIGSGIPVDLDADGQLEIVTGCRALEPDGTLIWNDGQGDGTGAVGDFDADGQPEFVRSVSGTMVLVDTDGTLLWTATIPGSGTGGAPTVADFDGDGAPEVGVAALAYYTVFDTDGTVMWSNPTNDQSSSVTGSSVFDFDRDGSDEVVYADQFNLYVYDGATGLVRMDMPGHANGTLYEYPVIADVDNDGSTEIILSSNNYAYSGWTGITVIGDLTSTWAPARPIWNQFNYHITNIHDDGSVPVVQQENWLTWNNFRTGGTSLGPSDWLADLQPGPHDVCVKECWDDRARIWVAISNQGLLGTGRADAVLTQSSDLTPLATVTVSELSSGESVWAGPFDVERDVWGPGSLTLRVDSQNAIEECNEANNGYDIGGWPCDE
ncbi:MAG: hypothetical protein CL927_10615 [Deltaproteobacteria bacterium]|nr:hypothetical protein [Deltaproteobacteria bacterium]